MYPATSAAITVANSKIRRTRFHSSAMAIRVISVLFMQSIALTLTQIIFVSSPLVLRKVAIPSRSMVFGSRFLRPSLRLLS